MTDKLMELTENAKKSDIILTLNERINYNIAITSEFNEKRREEQIVRKFRIHWFFCQQ